LITDDTIVAISSAAGNGARAIVRLSGPDALTLAEGVFAAAAADLRSLGSFRCARGVASFHSSAGLDVSLPCRAYVFRAPRSFTRQDVVELHIPGSVVAACALVDHLSTAGARRAQAGEFTSRAFFSGRIDLSAAQAVADVIDAASDAQLRSALSALGGRLARLCGGIAAELAEALATVEASIDLAEEQIELDSPRELSRRLAAAADDLDRLAAQARDMPEHAHLPRAVLCGRPNAGKSSLLNALAGFDRAIVSPIAGTTRDVLSATIVLEGSAVLIQDAAGIGQSKDSLDQVAHAAARSAIEAADVLLVVADLTCDAGWKRGLAPISSFEIGACPLFQTVQSWRDLNPRAPMLLLASKADLLNERELSAKVAELASTTGLPVLATSATTGLGLSELARELANLLHLSASRGGEALGLHQWQRQCIVAARHAAQRASDLLAVSIQLADQAELVAVELRDALAQLGQISGQIVTEDILGRIFARFCVGK
jgi:tRNA modification GTPase